MSHKQRALRLLIVLSVVLIYGLMQSHIDISPVGNISKLDQIVRAGQEQNVSCDWIVKQKPIVVLAIGQSNAGNHGGRALGALPPIHSISKDNCILATDPLPGSTGNGGSIWLRVPSHFTQFEPNRLLVISAMGIDATSIEDWTKENSALAKILADQVKFMASQGLPPQLVLWQQGEAEAKFGTSVEAYSAGLDQLAKVLELAQSNATIVLARSTVCRSAPNAQVRAAIALKAASNSQFQLGPDTDTLTGSNFRVDGCHFSAEGLDLAAQMWAETIARLARKSQQTRYSLHIANLGAQIASYTGSRSFA